MTGRTMVADEVTGLARRMWMAAGHGELVMRVPDPGAPGGRVCSWCRGTGALGLYDPQLWEWPAQQLRCPRCSPGRCVACRSDRGCRCDRADLTVALGLGLVDSMLGWAGVEAAADAQETLLSTAERAEAYAGAGPRLHRLGDVECPVCSSRELFADTSCGDDRKWAVYCERVDCVCSGVGCRCGIGTPRRAGGRHVWPRPTWSGRLARLGLGRAA